MTIRPGSSGLVPHIALAIAVAIVALPATAHGDAQEIPLNGAVVVCAQAGGTLTTPDNGLIFACTFPPSIPVLEVFGTPLLLHALPNLCFAAGGSRFGVDPLENALVCLE